MGFGNFDHMIYYKNCFVKDYFYIILIKIRHGEVRCHSGRLDAILSPVIIPVPAGYFNF